MKIIKKGSDADSKSGFVRSLTEHERRLLAETWTPSSSPHFNQQSLLLGLREQQQWLVCDCKHYPPVIMFPRRYSSGVIGLVNHADHNEHELGCPFWRITNTEAEEKAKKLRRIKQRSNFCFHQKLNLDREKSESADEVDSKKKSTTKKADPSIVRLIYILIALSRLDRFGIEAGLNQASALERIKNAARNLSIDNHFKLSDCLYTQIDQIAAATRMLHQTLNEWTRSARPHAVFIVLFDRFTYRDNRLVITTLRKNDGQWVEQNHTFPEHLKVSIPYRINRSEGGPYIMAFTLADPEGRISSPFFSPCKAAIVPVLTKEHPLPVDSRFERESFKVLRNIIRREEYYKKGITVIKPVTDLIAPLSNEPCRPDIILECGVKKVIIEVMGSHSEDYLYRKERTIELMNEIAPVYEFDALSADLKDELKPEAYDFFYNIVSMLVNGHN